ncbi:LysR substrate-binding domain-containing protein [Vogesella indigofera]|uniref:LysR substrate-binding domain-containing protein n=1 Tax=Vogesella indigofera TaxID=45465 RepID=UPI00234EB515|nr:LysR substrate-binding domain-containing protein [Vogesella indigofera]MDC7712357.1 LysR substrate-binding domain-containing protein [Vogesella indigofera]
MIQELRTFVAVAKNGTFASAGEQIGLTQSAVSSQIKRLEDTLGYRLFDRTGRSAILNEFGCAALAKSEEIIALFSRMCDSPCDDIHTGTLNVGAISSLQSTILARALIFLRGRYPKLRVRIIPGISMHLMDKMDTGQIDAALIVRPPFGVLPEMKWQTLIYEPFALLVHCSLAEEDWRALIEAHTFIRYERTSSGGRMVDRFLRSENLAVNDFFELDEIQGIVRMVANNLGVALLPLSESVFPLPESVRVVSLGGGEFNREIGFVQRKTMSNQLIVSHLAQCLHQSAKLSNSLLRCHL